MQSLMRANGMNFPGFFITIWRKKSRKEFHWIDDLVSLSLIRPSPRKIAEGPATFSQRLSSRLPRDLCGEAGVCRENLSRSARPERSEG